jgi:hypothetical protein
VLIEVLISEITLNEDSSIGLELDFTGQNSGHHNLNSQVTLDHGSMGNTNSHINTLNNLRGLKATLLNPGNFEAFLQNVQQNNKIKVISRPKILTANNKAANFSATQKTPILKTTNADGVVNNSVDYIDIGVELKVLPRINTDDYINLDITQTIQEVIGTDATALNSPIYSDRVVQTCLLVKNNHTLIMGGIISTSERENISKVPLLGDISLIRDIFRKKSKTRQQTELLIFITPHIMRSYQISDEFTRLQAESLGHAESYQSFEDENKKYAKVHIKNQPFVGNVVSVDIKNKSLMINTVSEDGLEVGKNYEVVRKNQTIFDVNTHQISGYDTDLLAQIMIVRRDSNDLFSALILEQDERNLIKPGDYVRVQRGSMLPDEKFSDTKLHVRIECDNKESPECLARVAVSGKYIGEDALLYDFVNDGACTAETKFFGAKEREYRSEIVETTPIGEYTRYRFKVFFEPVIKKGDDYFLEYVTPLPENWAKEIKKERRFKLNSTNYNDGIYDMVYPDDFPVVDVEPEPVAILHQDGKKIYRYYKAKEKFNLKINHEFGESK